MVGLVGPNGAGKSTFLDVLSGFIAPSSGRVRELSSGSVLRRHALLARSVRLHQVLLLPDLTGYEFLALAQFPALGTRLFSRRHSDKKVDLDRTLPILQVADLNSKLGVALGNLSWGQQRLVAIAGVLSSAKKIGLLDEPFAGLDPAAKAALVSQLKAEKSHRLLLVAEHDIESLTQVADRVLVFVGGQLMAEELPDVLTSSRLLQLFQGGKRHAQN